MNHLSVYRMEHVTCPDSPGHGPFVLEECRRGYRDRPEFGTSGRPPSSRQHFEQCGVLWDQLIYWWTDAPAPRSEAQLRFERAGWMFVRYDVPFEECREDNGQIVFCARREYRVGLAPWSEIPRPDGDDFYEKRNEFHSNRSGIVRPPNEIERAA